MQVREAKKSDKEDWYRMRTELWPDWAESAPKDIDNYFESRDEEQITFMAFIEGKAVGFAEVSIRKYADGCKSSNVGYLEGWFVDNKLREKGIGKELVVAAEEWSKSKNCIEMASDCTLDNEVSYNAHLSLGYKEHSRAIHFCKLLD